MKGLLKPSVVYSILGVIALTQVITMIYSSAVGMSHSAQYNLLSQEKAQLEERKLVLESTVASERSVSAIPTDVQQQFSPISNPLALSSPTSIALVQ